MNARRISDRPAARAVWVTHLLSTADVVMSEMATACGKRASELGLGHYFVGSVALDTVTCTRCKSAKEAA